MMKLRTATRAEENPARGFAIFTYRPKEGEMLYRQPEAAVPRSEGTHRFSHSYTTESGPAEGNSPK